jgi:hypothetical protein
VLPVHDVSRPVEDPEQLRTGRRAFHHVVDALGSGRHVLVWGRPGSGRSSIVLSSATAIERGGGWTVRWRPVAYELDRTGEVVRSLLSAVVEDAFRRFGPLPPLIRWRERVWLGDRNAPSFADELVTGMVLSRGSIDDLDQHVLVADLTRLRQFGVQESPAVIVLDDADSLFEDVEVVERLLDASDASGWRLLLSGTHRCGRPLEEARSPARRKLLYVPLMPPRPHEVLDLLSLGGELEHLMPAAELERIRLAESVGRLAEGLPLQIALVGRALAEEATTEDAPMALSVRSLQRAVRLLAINSRHPDDLRRLQRLNRRDLESALKLVPYHRMSFEEIAVCRAKSVLVLDPHLRVDLTSKIEALERHLEQIRSEAEALERIGLIKSKEEGAFSLTGGGSARLLYEVAARELLDTDTAPLPFGMTFPFFFGGALTRTVVQHAIDALGGGVFLGGLRPREYLPATDFVRELEADAAAADDADLLSMSAVERVENWLDRDGCELLIVGSALGSAESQVEGVHVFVLTRSPEEGGFERALMDARAKAEDLLSDCGLRWLGAEYLRRSGREGVLMLHRIAGAQARFAVYQSYGEGNLEKALTISKNSVDAFGESVAESAKVGAFDTSAQYGFLLVAAGRFDEAREILQPLTTTQKRHQWLASWNLSIALAGSANLVGASEALARAPEQVLPSDPGGPAVMLGWNGQNVVPFYVESLDEATIKELVEAQRRLLDASDAERGRIIGSALAEQLPRARPLLDAVASAP